MVDHRDDVEQFEKFAERLATRIMELANTADDNVRAAGIREFFADDYVLHSSSGGTVVGIDAYIERIATNLITEITNKRPRAHRSGPLLARRWRG